MRPGDELIGIEVFNRSEISIRMFYVREDRDIGLSVRRRGKLVHVHYLSLPWLLRELGVITKEKTDADT